MSGWPNLVDLVGNAPGARVGLLGAPLAAGSVTPGRCDLAPDTLRKTLRRIGRYDMETGHELSATVHDRGDIAITGKSIEEATAPIVAAVSASVAAHELTLLVGGNNAITRPAVLGLDVPIEDVGLITLDAHLDMRDLDEGLGNGNPVRALIADGLPGRNIAQIGLAPFANSRSMHEDALRFGNMLVTIDEVRRRGIGVAVVEALKHVSHCRALVVDCDIDVIDRAQFPAAPGSRPGGMQMMEFMAAVRSLAAQPTVRLIDLTEWDPPLDSTDLSALTAGRWMAECLAGFESR